MPSALTTLPFLMRSRFWALCSVIFHPMWTQVEENQVSLVSQVKDKWTTPPPPPPSTILTRKLKIYSTACVCVCVWIFKQLILFLLLKLASPHPFSSQQKTPQPSPFGEDWITHCTQTRCSICCVYTGCAMLCRTSGEEEDEIRKRFVFSASLH